VTREDVLQASKGMLAKAGLHRFVSAHPWHAGRHGKFTGAPGTSMQVGTERRHARRRSNWTDDEQTWEATEPSSFAQTPSPSPRNCASDPMHKCARGPSASGPGSSTREACGCAFRFPMAKLKWSSEPRIRFRMETAGFCAPRTRILHRQAVVVARVGFRNPATPPAAHRAGNTHRNASPAVLRKPGTYPPHWNASFRVTRPLRLDPWAATRGQAVHAFAGSVCCR